MSISFVGFDSNVGNTVPIPAHQAGDLIVVAASREGLNMVTISPPSDWVLCCARGGIGPLVFCKQAESSSETSGTWTNATHMVCAVYRHTDNLLTGAFAFANGGTGTSIAFWNLASSSTFTDKWSIAIAVTGTTGVGVGSPPSGMVNRGTLVSTDDIAWHDTDSNAASTSNRAITLSASSAWGSALLEISDSGIPKASVGASFPPIGPGGLVY